VARPADEPGRTPALDSAAPTSHDDGPEAAPPDAGRAGGPEPGDDRQDSLDEAVAAAPAGLGATPAGTSGGGSVTPERRGRARGRRASVPSWDDILLGTRRSD
jgi:hypothetical protein